MNSLLQTCKLSNEAYSIILTAAKEIFVNLSGGLAILNASINNFETVMQWGNKQTLKSLFTLSDCWSLRKGSSYLVNDPTKDILCTHFNAPPSNPYVCLPLIVQSDIMGLLVFHTDFKNTLSRYQLQLATSFCEVIQLSLTNIKLRETLYEQAIHDPLTGLFNRRYMDETLARELHRAIREKNVLCVAMLDLDFFKHFNDENGHEAGDEILKVIGAILKNNFRFQDIACRFGGEEFLVIMVNTTLTFAYQRLEQIREKFKKAEVYFQGHILPPITVSIGIAEAPTQGMTAEEIICAADEALYSAKQNGRDRTERFIKKNVLAYFIYSNK